MPFAHPCLVVEGVIVAFSPRDPIVDVDSYFALVRSVKSQEEPVVELDVLYPRPDARGSWGQRERNVPFSETPQPGCWSWPERPWLSE